MGLLKALPHHMLGCCRGIIFGKAVDDLDNVGEGEARIEINDHAVYTARLASIPFGLAAIGMVVSTTIRYSRCLLFEYSSAVTLP